MGAMRLGIALPYEKNFDRNENFAVFFLKFSGIFFDIQKGRLSKKM